MDTKKIILGIVEILSIIIFLINCNISFVVAVNSESDIQNQSQNMRFDLSLKNYVSSIYSNGVLKEGRQEPLINTKKLSTGESLDAVYEQNKKQPLQVKYGDYVIYTFTVYNEGNIDGYVNKITENIPKGLQFIYISEDEKTLIACDSEGNTETLSVDSKIYELIEKNNTYWALDSNETQLLRNTYNGSETISITCDVESYLGEKKLLKSYDATENTLYDGSNLDRLSITLVLRVIAQDESRLIIRNEATIAEAEDINGNIQDKESMIRRTSFKR